MLLKARFGIDAYSRLGLKVRELGKLNTVTKMLCASGQTHDRSPILK